MQRQKYEFDSYTRYKTRSSTANCWTSPAEFEINGYRTFNSVLIKFKRRMTSYYVHLLFLHMTAVAEYAFGGFYSINFQLY
jgi:hypothetical protein